MDLLKQSRGHLKGAITRAFNFVLEITEQTDIDSLEARLQRLEETWIAFCKNQNELFAFHTDENYGDPEIDFEATETKYLATKGSLLKAIRKGLPKVREDSHVQDLLKQQAAAYESLINKSTNFTVKEKTDIELPSFKITPFSGDYREWPGFRDMFLGSIDCKTNFPGAQKLRYLKSFLRDDAAKLLNHIEISDTNYQLAWEKLVNRYNKPLYIINAYIENFLKIPSVPIIDSVKLRYLTDNADEVVRGLETLRAETKDPWLIYILINKVDADTRKAWALDNSKAEKATVSDLIDFLEKRCSALEASEPKIRTKQTSSRSIASQNVKSLTASHSSCPKCKAKHLLPECEQFISMSIPSRRDFVRDQKLCYRCLGSQHSSSRCKSKTSCSQCQYRHHTLVHLEKSNSLTSPSVPPSTVHMNKPDSLASSSASSSIAKNSMDASYYSGSSPAHQFPLVSNHTKNKTHSSGILPTVLVNITDVNGNLQPCRVLLDTGSQVSFVSEKLAKRLGLRRRHARIPINGISSLEAGVTNGVVTVNLVSRFDSNQLAVEAYILNEITSQTPLRSFEFNDLSILEDLEMADPDFNKSGPIDLLLGSDKAWAILRDGRRIAKGGSGIAQNTAFGWVITGSLPESEITSFVVGINNDLDKQLRSFWEIEELPHKNSQVQDDDAVDSHFTKTFSRASDGKYVVDLPFRYTEVKFGNTLSGALSRLSAMERRFSRNKTLQADYVNFMKTYAELGHMERIPEGQIEPTSGHVFYLPHHAVVTNKIRVVFDGSYKDSFGKSLNEMLHIGPPLQRNLVNVCIRFRMHKYVFCADIVKMFRQIWVHEHQRDFQRIVWRESPDKPVEHYRLCTVTYGTSPAPFLSMKVLKQIAIDYKEQFPLASRCILQDFYVDDILTGADSVFEIVRLKDELVELLSCGGFNLSKWSSNCWPLLNGIDRNDIVSMDLSSGYNYTKILGLVWHPYRDVFTFQISLDKESLECTKRKLLSEVAKIFDPLGFLSPSTILLKILFQELWLHKSKIGWDDPLPKEVAERWALYRQELPFFEKLEIPRRCTEDSKYFDLIGFSDASEKAYSAVIYTRSVSKHGEVKVQIIAAKTRVSPVKQLSIPRLELCGALLLSRLVQLVNSSLDVKPRNIYAFCDSQIVLAWLASPPRRWSTLVSNRTSEILDNLPRSVWNHVRSEDNPADCASRGIIPSDLLQLDIWWKGPAWLTEDMVHSPNFVNFANDDLLNAPEERKLPVMANVTTSAPHFMENVATRISSWTKLIRVIAYVLRYVKNLKLATDDRKKSFLSSSELLHSKQFCISYAQREFKVEIEDLRTKSFVANSSSLSSLSPFIDESGLLRVGGRISNSITVPYSIKHPIILPKKHIFTRMILVAAHLKFLHAGVSALFALVRQEFWVIGGRNLIRNIVFKCLKCFRLRKETSTQLMGNLPLSRLSPSFAFDHTGCDYAGPITLRLSRGRNPKFVKGYFAIFVCMATKAIHLEVVSDLSTDAFLAALNRFIARRGKCSCIYSDNGTNFQGASRILSEWFQLIRSREHNERIHSTLAADEIKWQFIPPQSPHFGGLWEAGVKCVKQHLRRVVGNSVLTFEEMSTLLYQIEALLNSRPLCSISDTDLNPLTPSHFLIGRPHTAVPEPSYLQTSPNRLGRWEMVQSMMQGFWQKWNTDYITSLQQRPKWQKMRRIFQVGDIVVVKELNSPPSKWSLGRIEEVHPGQDGIVRVVSVRSKNTLYKRPITKLALLPHQS